MTPMGKLFEVKYIFITLPMLMPYVPVTLLLLFACFLASVVLGILLALARIYPLPVVTPLSRILCSFILGVPLLTLLFMFYFGLPELFLLIGVNLTRTSGVYFVIAAFGLHYGAVLQAHLRTAVGSVGRGQFEAAYSIGLPFLTALRRVVMPQAMRVLIPNVANTYLKAMKSTSIAFSAGVMDLMGRAESASLVTGHPFESYMAVAIVYGLLYYLLNYLFRYLEERSLRSGAY
jgi:L-cystine transport system permease protein